MQIICRLVKVDFPCRLFPCRSPYEEICFSHAFGEKFIYFMNFKKYVPYSLFKNESVLNKDENYADIWYDYSNLCDMFHGNDCYGIRDIGLDEHVGVQFLNYKLIVDEFD